MLHFAFFMNVFLLYTGLAGPQGTDFILFLSPVMHDHHVDYVDAVATLPHLHAVCSVNRN